MKKLVFLFIMVIGLISCSSDDDTQIEGIDLIGKWNWVSSCGGFSGGCWYPSEENFESIEFKNDFSYIQKINGEIVTETNYSITETIMDDTDLLFKIEFQNDYKTFFRFINGNLSFLCGDFWKEYERIN